MTRTFDPRSRYSRRKPLELTPQLAHDMLQAVIIQGGQPTCKECGKPATEIALPSGTPVCASHGDSRA